jgi:hypothetical protein
MTTLPSNAKYKVENYPYGYTLKTDKFYSVEFKAGKGFRLVEQTINPKTNQLNMPKKSVYYPAMLLTVSDDNRVKAHVEDFYGDSGKDKGYKFMFDNFHNFTTEEIKSIAIHNLMLLKADIIAKCTYCGSDSAKMFPLYDSAIPTLATIAKTGENLWNQITIDWKAVEALEIPNFKPFTVVETYKLA